MFARCTLGQALMEVVWDAQEELLHAYTISPARSDINVGAKARAPLACCGRTFAPQPQQSYGRFSGGRTRASEESIFPQPSARTAEWCLGYPRTRRCHPRVWTRPHRGPRVCCQALGVREPTYVDACRPTRRELGCGHPDVPRPLLVRGWNGLRRVAHDRCGERPRGACTGCKARRGIGWGLPGVRRGH